MTEIFQEVPVLVPVDEPEASRGIEKVVPEESSDDDSSESEEDQVVPMEEYRQESPYDFSPWDREGPARVNQAELDAIVRSGNRSAVELDNGVMVYDHEDLVCWYFWSFGESSPWADWYDVGHGI